MPNSAFFKTGAKTHGLLIKNTSGLACWSAARSSFNFMRVIVEVGWAIFLIGYYTRGLLGQVDEAIFIVVYNHADFLTKNAFVLA